MTAISLPTLTHLAALGLTLLGPALAWSPQSAGEDEGTATLTPRTPSQEGDDPLVIVHASDGKLATPGRIPEATPRDAVELWQGLVASLALEGESGPAPEPGTPRAFELVFSVRNRAESGTQLFDARFAYLDVAGGLIRGTTLNSKGEAVQVQMRSIAPGGRRHEYHYRKFKGSGATDDWVRLTARDHKEARQQTDEWAAISYDIARLTDPGSFRIVRLQVRKLAEETDLAAGFLRFEGDTGILLPRTDIEGVLDGREKRVSSLAGELIWLQLDTPDFELFARRDAKMRPRKGERTEVRRLVLGLDPASKEPRLVLVSPERDGPLQVPGSVLVQCTEWMEQGPAGARTRLPGRFFAYETPLPMGRSGPPRFSDTAIADLFLLEGGTMRADLTPEDFRPPR